MQNKDSPGRQLFRCSAKLGRQLLVIDLAEFGGKLLEFLEGFDELSSGAIQISLTEMMQADSGLD
jgi:hypothetical protein